MTPAQKIPHATTAWFEMVGALMCEAVSDAPLAADYSISLLERFTDGAVHANGLIDGFRVDVIAGKPVFRVGVGADETAEIVIEVTRKGSYDLNSRYAADPSFETTLAGLLASGDMRIEGDLSRASEWMGSVHDPIVERTAPAQS